MPMHEIERLFLRVVETGSFKRAAEQLNHEPSSVSRKIAALEDRLKVKLLRRSTQRSTPTELGQLYYERMRYIIDEQDELEEEMRSGVNRLSGSLRIAAPVDFGARFVVPAVRQMQLQAEDLNIELLLGSYFDNLQERSLDVAVRIGNLPDSSLVAKKLGDVPRVLVASLDYIEAFGEPQSIDELVKHNFVLYSPETRRNDIRFEDGQRFHHGKIRSNITVNSVSAIRELVLDGVGIHLGPKWVFEEDLKAGKVVPLLKAYRPKSFPVHAVYLAREYLPFKIKEFTRLLADTIVAK